MDHSRINPGLAGALASRFFRDRRLMILTILLVVAAGGSSLLVLPRMEDPLLTPRAARVTTIYPGADADRVEALVTEKIEDQLRDIPEIKRLRSQSRASVSFISIELRDEVLDSAPIWSEIRGKIEDSIALLPKEASRPEFDETDVAAFAWIGALVWDEDQSQSSSMLRRLARDFKDVLMSIPGTKEVDLFGDPLEEILVDVDPDRATAAGLTAAEIARQLSSGDVKSSLGLLRTSTDETMIKMDNEFHTMEDILQVHLQSPQAGQTLLLTDVAKVRRSTQEPPASKAIIDGKRGIVLGAMLRPEFRIDQWATAAEPIIASYQKRLPRGISMNRIMEQNSYVQIRMKSLVNNLLLGVLAVAVVTFLFLGWRSSLLVTATLPIASLMVIAGMRFLEIPIHQMSITGLIIALGLLIDNAIIAADEIEISLRRGLAPADAVADMVGRLFIPLLASTVTTALAFAPIALMEGPAGEFVGAIAITVMLAIFSSLFLSMTILPAAAAMLRKSSSQHAADGHASFISRMMQHGISIPAMTAIYRTFIRFNIKNPFAGIALGCVLPFCGFISATQLSEQFFPPADRDQFYIEVEQQPQAAIADTESVARQIDEVLGKEPRVSHTSWFLGESGPTFYYNVIARRKGNPNYAQAIVTLRDNDSSLTMIRRLQTELDRKFPQSRILVRQLEQGPPFDAPLEVRLFGPDLDELKRYGEQLRLIASQIPTVIHARSALNESRPVATIKVDSAQAAWAGLSESQVADQLFAKFEGLNAGSIIEQVEQIPVRVRLAGIRRSTIEQLKEASLQIDAPRENGSNNVYRVSLVNESIPISSLASVSLEPQRAVITRYDGRRLNEIQGFIIAGTLPATALAKFEKLYAESGIKLPPGYRLEYGGEASERDAAVGRLLANVSILAIGMVASLVLALSSFRLASLIGVVAFLSIGLGLGGLWIFGYPFGFMAIIGTMGLIGIAINDSIVVVSALKENDAVRAGDCEATVETVMEVTRHVLATTATTMVGFLPLLISGGGFWPPLAIAISVGVAGATLISLTLVPSAMRLYFRGAAVN